MSAVALRAEDRDQLRALLDGRTAGDARAAYYALHHPASRVRLWMHAPVSGPDSGFLVRAQTGQDLFRPLVIVRARHARTADELLRAALPEGSPFLLSLTEEAARWPLPIRLLEPAIKLQLMELAPARFEPVINIFVVRSQTPDGLPRYEIRQGDRLLAAAGVNWQSPDWAEVFVHTDPDVQNRGYGKSVASALCRQLAEEKRRVLYAVEQTNRASRRLAESIGFADTGSCEQVCICTLADASRGDTRFERLA
jgi:RimJ/RimL family protein N-acetyltransferase